MNKSKLYKSLSRIMATFMLLTIGFVYCSGFTAFAAVDLDVTIVPPEDSVRNKQEFEVNLKIDTKSTNGYVELQINIEYDADLLALSAPVNMDGYKVTGSKGQLTLTYFDPTGTNTPTPIGNEALIPIKFIVLESAPDSTTKIKATIDHAYNDKGKNITWTAIYDKEIEIIRINDSVDTSSETSSEEVSSVFVVGEAGTVSRTSSVAGNGGKIASVVIGAIVVFAAGVVVGYIICMRKYEKYKGSGDEYDDDYYYEDEYIGDSGVDSSGENNYADSLYPDNNDDGYYTRSRDEYSVSDEDDYFTSVPVGNGGSGNYLDAFNAPSIASRSVEPVEFGSMINSSFDSISSNDDDDDYPILFMTRDGGNSGSRSKSSSSSKPTFDEQVDSLFGKYSDNVERNVDDGYGGSFSSSTRRRDNRSERSRRNR